MFSLYFISQQHVSTSMFYDIMYILRYLSNSLPHSRCHIHASFTLTYITTPYIQYITIGRSDIAIVLDCRIPCYIFSVLYGTLFDNFNLLNLKIRNLCKNRLTSGHCFDFLLPATVHSLKIRNQYNYHLLYMSCLNLSCCLCPVHLCF